MPEPQLVIWYFADPMCSWCWGFAPVMTALRDIHADRVQLALMMGGLRPGTTEPMTPEARAEILHHWEAVHERSGQPFKIENALPDGFIYDTEPACRAVVTLLDLNPTAAFDYFKSVQAAFYAEGRDVTQPAVLAELAAAHGVAADAFLDGFASAPIQQMTRTHFRQTAEIGVRGFPTVILQKDARFDVLTYGYRPLAELAPVFERWMTEATGSS